MKEIDTRNIFGTLRYYSSNRADSRHETEDSANRLYDPARAWRGSLT